MKLRFRSNTLRLRVNRSEVEALAAGRVLQERVLFPGDAELTYRLESSELPSPSATFDRNVIRVIAPHSDVQTWAADETIGLYFDVPAASRILKVSIEKDLECIDGPAEEHDPDAFARDTVRSC